MEFLNNGFLDLNYLNDVYKKDLDIIFDRVSKPCYILWDYKTKLQVYSIYSPEVLKQKQLKNVVFEDIDDDISFRQVKSMIFFIPSNIKMIDLVESFVNRKLCKEYHLVFVPIQLTCHYNYMEQKKLTSKFISIRNFQCYGLPLESDLISLENPNYILDMTDRNVLFLLARTVIIIQNIFGKIHRINGKGESVSEFLKILEIQEESMGGFNSTGVNNDGEFLISSSKLSQIDQMLVFDRRVDMLTPLLSQITYESLLDELFHIDSGFVGLPSVFLSEAANKRADLSVYQLNSSDTFYGEIRDQPIYEALNKIIQFSHEVKAEREKFLKAKKIDELAEVTRNLKSFLTREANAEFHLTMGMTLNKYTRMSNHTDFVRYQSNFLSQEDLDKQHPYAEECFLKKLDIEKLIQLICIQSVCSSGLKPKLLNYYKKEILRTYGVQYRIVLARLERLGLLSGQQNSSMMMNLTETNFDVIVRSLNLLPESESISNIYAGFVPVITRLTQFHRKNPPGGWDPALSKALSLIPGGEVSRQQPPRNAVKNLDASASLATGPAIDTIESPLNNRSKRVVLVICIGGITRSEISTLRMLSQQDGMNTNFLILTTGIINPQKFLEQLTKPLETATSSSLSNPFE